MVGVIEWVTGLFPAGGWFVEAGAHDGIGDSQTYQLEKTGKWRGVCVEPSSAFAGLSRRRRCRVDNRALGAADGATVTFREVTGNAIELSGLLHHFADHWDRQTRPHVDRTVTTVTLNSLLEEHQAPKVIEFLSLDTEGSELVILTAHDFDRHRFLAIQVEHNGVKRKSIGLWALLTGRGYTCLEDDGTNVRYVHASAPRAK